MLYLSGVNNPTTDAAQRDDFGLLVTPLVPRMYPFRVHYPAWAMDNGCFPEARRFPIQPSAVAPHASMPHHIQVDPIARAIRYDLPDYHWPMRKSFLAMLESCDPTGCLFASAPDVVGNYAATWERSCQWFHRIRSNGFRPAIVMQDGLEHDRFVWGSMLNECDDNDGVLFIGGSDEFKLSHSTATLVGEAKRRGIWVHMGRVNSYKRIAYAESIGCDSADGTYLAHHGGERGARHIFTKWLDPLRVQPSLPMTEGGSVSEQTSRQKVKARTATHPAPTTTAKTVPKGESSRMAKGREAQAKAAENKRRVDEINERDAARARAAEACDTSGADLAFGSKAADPKPTATVDDDMPLLSSVERLELYREARKEVAARQAARIAGLPEPPTPKRDELERRQAMEAKTGAPKTKNGKAKKATATKSPRLVKANEARKAAGGKMKANAKELTDQQILDYIVKVRKADTSADMVTERRYARFVENINVSAGRFDGLWALAVKGTTTAPVKEPKAAAVKKAAPVKKATAAKKATPAKAAAKKATPAKGNGSKADALERLAKAVKAPAKKTTGGSRQVEPNFKAGVKVSAARKTRRTATKK